MTLAPPPSKLHDPQCAAEAADLTYVSDDMPGITRRRFGKGFAYYAPDGRKISDAATIERINQLAIPPAYHDVWICPAPDGHLQATGVDDRGRKQYRYHPRWSEVRDRVKYGKLIPFARRLPSIRRRVRKDLKQPGLPKNKVLAACIKVLEATLIRVGNDEYARDNKSFGLTTLRNRHADVNGKNVTFHFVGKGGIEHDLDLADGALARIVSRCQDLPGQELFGYLDDGKPVDISSTDVNDYLHEIAGDVFTAKDFRTWHGTVIAAAELRDRLLEDPPETQAATKKAIVSAVDDVADALGNTRAVCRKCYIHPRVFEAFEQGTLAQTMERAKPVRGLRVDESQTLAVLRQK